ncbi:MAG TPA: hypothetical protein VK203_25870 [Nostocaceae cyanobacterium]|nr:hypothetical protein [Nostocaceae cyanobacterium]
MTALSIVENRKIAIVDDDKTLAEATAWEVEAAGYEPLLFVDGHFQDVNELVTCIMSKNVQGSVCDHRLSNSGLANFYGAQLVAALYDLKLPSILITQYTDIDTSSSIRKWRNKIPVLLSREQADASSIAKGIENCRLELAGKRTGSRKPYRTIVRITNIDAESHEPVVDAFVPGWNPHKAVRFPASLMPKNMIDVIIDVLQSKPNIRLFARVNIGAENYDDLYFENFELAPEPDDDDGLT